jgi:hypothetical protein
MRFAFIRNHQEVWPITIQCEALAVSLSRLYAWRGREPSPADLRREMYHELTDKQHRNVPKGTPGCW